MNTQHTNDKITEYKVIKLKFLEEDDEKDSHYVYLKKYRSERKSSSKPIGKTLLVLNVPPYATKESIKNVFSIAGDVENVTLIDDFSKEHKYEIPSKIFQHKSPFKFLIAFIVYKKSCSLETIFSVDELPVLSTDSEILCGIEKWTTENNEKIVDIESMQKEIDEYMKHFDKLKEAGENDEADDDGWIKVGKKGHYAGFKQNEDVIHRLEQKLETQRKKAKINMNQISGIYAFESRENKKRELLDLRKKFEEDKSKLKAMRQNRKFKPY